MRFSGLWVLVTCCHFCLAQEITEKDKPLFDGFYGGITSGSQNIFGGSNVDGADILAQDSRWVMEFNTGFRKQFFSDRWVVGLEYIVGITNGDLSYHDPAEPLTIQYENNTQWSIGGMTGMAVGSRRKHLPFFYMHETTRKFDVRITDANGTYRQQDEQGMLKFGIGYEMVVFKNLHARISAGAMRVDFGDRVTNIDVEDKYDFMAGVLWQF